MSDDPSGDAINRCSEFIHSLVDVCREHRVLINYDDASGEFTFEEQSNCPSGHGYILDMNTVETSVRLELFEELTQKGETE